MDDAGSDQQNQKRCKALATGCTSHRPTLTRERCHCSNVGFLILHGCQAELVWVLCLRPWWWKMLAPDAVMVHFKPKVFMMQLPLATAQLPLIPSILVLPVSSTKTIAAAIKCSQLLQHSQRQRMRISRDEDFESYTCASCPYLRRPAEGSSMYTCHVVDDVQ